MEASSVPGHAPVPAPHTLTPDSRRPWQPFLFSLLQSSKLSPKFLSLLPPLPNRRKHFWKNKKTRQNFVLGHKTTPAPPFRSIHTLTLQFHTPPWGWPPSTLTLQTSKSLPKPRSLRQGGPFPGFPQAAPQPFKCCLDPAPIPPESFPLTLGRQKLTYTALVSPELSLTTVYLSLLNVCFFCISPHPAPKCYFIHESLPSPQPLEGEPRAL